MFRKLSMIVPVAVIAMGSTACATKKFVRTSVGEVNAKADSISRSLEETQERTRQNEGKIADVDQRAQAAGTAATNAQSAADKANQAAVDYLIAGTVFKSRSKAGVSPIGLDGLAAIVARTRLPVLAVGGVMASHFVDVTAAGAAGGAAIGLFADSDQGRIEELVRALVCPTRSS